MRSLLTRLLALSVLPVASASSAEVGNRALSGIQLPRKGFELIRAHYGKAYDLATVPAEPRTIRVPADLKARRMASELARYSRPNSSR